MKTLSAFFLILALGCSGNRHETMGPHWSYLTWDCDCSSTMTTRSDGTFRDKNEYVQNPLVNCSDSVQRFATIRVLINDSISLPLDSLNSSAFEIPLKNFGFQNGDPVHIAVEHYGCAQPKMLNPEVR